MRQSQYHRLLRWLCLVLVVSMFALTGSQTYVGHAAKTMNSDFPDVDPAYIYDQLAYMATHFQHRESGFDANLPVEVNGHDEFAAYWSQEMLHNLDGFGAQVRHDSFPTKGWKNRSAVVPAFNVEVTIPGASQPDQLVIVGCHYDGEAISTQSAYDDTSGCAIALGVAKGMANYWRTQHSYPARTLRFILFDAEEQGLLGSYHYVNQTANGEIKNIVAMFNEEQSGMAYPVRYLGKAENPLMPLSVETTPVQLTTLQGEMLERSKRFRALQEQSLPEVFARFRALGYRGLTYHTKDNKDEVQEIFTPEQLKNVIIEDDRVGGSDQIPFTKAQVPCATYVGNASYYERNAKPDSYPYDQREDTIELLNTYAQGGAASRSNALMLALALPGMLTNWMLHQPAVLGEAAANEALKAGSPISINVIGPTEVGKEVVLEATPGTAQGNKEAYAWDFGDGTTAKGAKVSHSYQEAKTYTLTLKTESTKQMRTQLSVVQHATSYDNDYEKYQITGRPTPNPKIRYPVADSTKKDRIVGLEAAIVATSTATPGKQTTSVPGEQKERRPDSTLVWIISLIVLLILVGAVGLGSRRWLQRK